LKALECYLQFARSQKQVYRIIDEAEFADPHGFEKHYRTTATRIAARLDAGKAKGEVVKSDSKLASEVEAWAIMGMNVFLGLRFAVWGREKPKEVARLANRLVRRGLEP
ncbi:MAG: TetR/AcrR family transcriptional regulator, partial [Sphingomonas sp.]|nr:TetR/AcrR family transcriptional regulator [Sphingomonas sp.]